MAEIQTKYSVEHAQKREKLFMSQGTLESKGKFVTYFSDTFFQCSPQYRNTHWFEHSDHHSYKGECKELVKGKQKFCA